MGTVYVLGAGVDCALGFPLASNLMSELDQFVKGDGRAASKAIKDKLGGGRRVRFSFEKYVETQGENSLETLLNNQTLVEALQASLDGIGDDASPLAKAVKTLIEKCEMIRAANDLDEDTALTLATGIGLSEDLADHTMFRTRGMTFNPSPRNAILRILSDTQSMEGLSTEEKEILDQFASQFKNFEELLTELFAGFFSRNGSGMRNYLYVSWILWVYMWWKSMSAQSSLSEVSSFYQHLSALNDTDSVITFNYSTIGDLPSEQTVRFHGDCNSYIRHDRGQMLSTDENVTHAADLNAIVAFINQLDMDVEANRIFLPAIVPPSAMKPLINREFIARWASAQRMLSDCESIIVVGYSFNRVDNHFNELFAAAAGGKRVAIINPDLEGTKAAVCALLGINPSTLTKQTIEGITVEGSNSLLFVPAYCENIRPDMLCKIQTGW